MLSQLVQNVFGGGIDQILQDAEKGKPQWTTEPAFDDLRDE